MKKTTTYSFIDKIEIEYTEGDGHFRIIIPNELPIELSAEDAMSLYHAMDDITDIMSSSGAYSRDEEENTINYNDSWPATDPRRTGIVECTEESTDE